MLGAAIEILEPWRLTLAAIAVVPVTAAVVAAMRRRTTARSLGLAPRGLRAVALPAGTAAAACALLALAVAQPVLRTTETRSLRTESEVLFVVDVSRSMRASTAADAPDRLDTARDVVRTIHTAVPDVPAGLAGLTDRVLPYVFATADERSFESTLARSVTAESPQPQSFGPVATSFGALAELGRNGFFGERAKHRTCVLVTDGEARSSPWGSTEPEPSTGPSLAPIGSAGNETGEEPAGTPGSAGAAVSAADACQLVVVRVGSQRDRVYGDDGAAEAAYRPDAAAGSKVAQLAQAAGGSAFDASNAVAAAAAVRSLASVGAVRDVGTASTTRGLAVFAAGAALLLICVLVVTRIPTRQLRRMSRRD